MEEDQGVLWYKERVCAPNNKELKDKIFWEAHESAYSIHLGRNKKYHDLKAIYWWYGIKRDVAKYVAVCDRESMPSINDMLDCCNPCNRLAKVAHFVPINTTYTESQLEELYDSRIVCFHEVTMRTVSDRET
jgi:hypothetical protein